MQVMTNYICKVVMKVHPPRNLTINKPRSPVILYRQVQCFYPAILLCQHMESPCRDHRRYTEKFFRLGMLENFEESSLPQILILISIVHYHQLIVLSCCDHPKPKAGEEGLELKWLNNYILGIYYIYAVPYLISTSNEIFIKDAA